MFVCKNLASITNPRGVFKKKVSLDSPSFVYGWCFIKSLPHLSHYYLSSGPLLQLKSEEKKVLLHMRNTHALHDQVDYTQESFAEDEALNKTNKKHHR